MTGLFLADYSVYGFLPDILTLKSRGFKTTTYSLIYGFALFMAFLGYNFHGWLSARTGRRKPLTQWYCVFLVVFGIPVFYVLYHAAIQRNLWMAVLGTVMAAMLKLAWGYFPHICGSASRPAVALPESGLDIPQAHCWERGSVPTSGGLIRSHSSRQSKRRIFWLSPAIILTIG